MDDQTARTDHIWRLSKALELTAHVYESYGPCVRRVTLLALPNMLRYLNRTSPTEINELIR